MRQNVALCGNGLSALKHFYSIINMIIVLTQDKHVYCIYVSADKMSFQNTVGKGENTSNRHFLLLPQSFSCVYLVICDCFQSEPVLSFVVW